MQGGLGTIHSEIRVAVKEFFMHHETKRVGAEIASDSMTERVKQYATKFRNESNDTLKLIDFGLSKQYEENGNAMSSGFLGCGTSGYAPLEQADGSVEKEFSPQIDVSRKEKAQGPSLHSPFLGEVVRFRNFTDCPWITKMVT